MIDLHAELDELLPSSYRRMLVHALIECGAVTELKCQYEFCLHETRDFDPGGSQRGKNPRALVVDHIVSQKNGGSDRPQNLQVLHHTCNGHKAIKVDTDPELLRELRSAQMRERWQDPEYREQQIKRLSQPRADTTNYPRGDQHWSRTPQGREKMRRAWEKRRACL